MNYGPARQIYLIAFFLAMFSSISLEANARGQSEQGQVTPPQTSPTAGQSQDGPGTSIETKCNVEKHSLLALDKNREDLQTLRACKQRYLNKIAKEQSDLDNLSDKISTTRPEMEELNSQINDDTTKLEQYKSDLTDSSALKATRLSKSQEDELDRKITEDVRNIDTIRKELQSLQNRVAKQQPNMTNDNQQILQSIQNKRNEMQADQDVIAAIYDKMDSIIDEDSMQDSHKIWITGIFALLIGAIIYSFFRALDLANKGDSRTNPVASLLASDVGIQFITVLSIIVSLALFGILGVMEGKELSALLGGLSGYILGRGRSQKEHQNPQGQGSGA